MRFFFKSICAFTLFWFATSASASLMFDWEFTTGDASLSGSPPDIISGTISGLVEGLNDGSGLTLTIDPTPLGTLFDQNWNFLDALAGPPAFVVSGGAVVSADARFQNADFDFLFMGTDPAAIVGGSTWAPQFRNAGFTEEYNSCSGVGSTFDCGVTRFTRSAAPVPLPGTVLLLGLGVLALGLRRVRLSRMTR